VSNGDARKLRRRAPGTAATISGALLLAGCFGDPPPDPAEAPLEIVVGSTQQPDQPCLLNRGEVAAGLHPVTVISEAGTATVALRDEQGRTVFEGRSGPGQTSVELAEGEYTVECVTGDRPVGTVVLRVTPDAAQR
jgi:hypothetical protein